MRTGYKWWISSNSVDVDRKATHDLKYKDPTGELPSHDKVVGNSTHDEGDLSPKNAELLNNGQGLKTKTEDKHSDISKKSRFLLLLSVFFSIKDAIFYSAFLNPTYPFFLLSKSFVFLLLLPSFFSFS